jgi:hypothetical protein
LACTRIVCFVVSSWLLFCANVARAQKRIALDIANSAYESISPLENPTYDAAPLRKTLSEVGFTVIVATDAN